MPFFTLYLCMNSTNKVLYIGAHLPQWILKQIMYSIIHKIAMELHVSGFPGQGTIHKISLYLTKKYNDTSEPQTSDPHKLKPLQSTMSSRSQIWSNKSRCRLVGDLVNQHCFVDVGNRNIIVRLTIEIRIKKCLVVVIKRNFIIRWYLYARIWTLKKVSTTEEGFFCKNTKKIKNQRLYQRQPLTAYQNKMVGQIMLRPGLAALKKRTRPY